jgi:FtsP/CotA-like multicopper oxidase with cupredoxin domain
MEWTPEREGNWLFHCHIMSHVSPDRRFDGGAALGDVGTSKDAPLHSAHAQAGTSKDVPLHSGHSAHAGHGSANHDRALGMAGMVLGITVLPPANTPPPAPKASVEPRRITMVIQPTRHETGAKLTAGFVITEAGAVAADAAAASPGPTLVLRRDEPVEITVVNRLAEATSIHWHGLELDSYYDGVHGWSGVNQRLAPMIDPGASFIVRITPPRAGTFIYHTHLHDYRQLTSGLYGPLIVTEPGETYDPATDHVVVLGRKHATDASSLYEDPETAVINGERSLQMVWRAGARTRIRIINIPPDDTLNGALVSRDTPVTWQPFTKDGAAVPEAEAQSGPAKLRIGVGETYDFTFDAPPGRATLWLDVRMSGGRWQSQARVSVK